MNTKNTATKSFGTDPSHALGDMAEKGNAQAREAYAKASTGTIEATELLKNYCTTAVKGVQDYNSKFMEFAHANSNSAFEYIQKLYEVKSPSAFLELSTEHSRKQFEALKEQGKELAALAHRAASVTAEPIKATVTKALYPAS
jgi:phasin